MINQEQLVEIHVLHQQRRSIFVTSLMSSVVDELIWPKDKRIFHTFDYPLNANLAKSLTHFCPKPSQAEFYPRHVLPQKFTPKCVGLFTHLHPVNPQLPKYKIFEITIPTNCAPREYLINPKAEPPVSNVFWAECF
jgi:hypothetical protein